MTPYEHGFLTKCAEAGLTERQADKLLKIAFNQFDTGLPQEVLDEYNRLQQEFQRTRPCGIFDGDGQLLFKLRDKYAREGAGAFGRTAKRGPASAIPYQKPVVYTPKQNYSVPAVVQKPSVPAVAKRVPAAAKPGVPGPVSRVNFGPTGPGQFVTGKAIKGVRNSGKAMASLGKSVAKAKPLWKRMAAMLPAALMHLR